MTQKVDHVLQSVASDKVVEAAKIVHDEVEMTMKLPEGTIAKRELKPVKKPKHPDITALRKVVKALEKLPNDESRVRVLCAVTIILGLEKEVLGRLPRYL